MEKINERKMFSTKNNLKKRKVFKEKRKQKGDGYNNWKRIRENNVYSQMRRG